MDEIIATALAESHKYENRDIGVMCAASILLASVAETASSKTKREIEQLRQRIADHWEIAALSDAQR